MHAWYDPVRPISRTISTAQCPTNSFYVYPKTLPETIYLATLCTGTIEMCAAAVVSEAVVAKNIKGIHAYNLDFLSVFL